MRMMKHLSSCQVLSCNRSRSVSFCLRIKKYLLVCDKCFSPRSYLQTDCNGRLGKQFLSSNKKLFLFFNIHPLPEYIYINRIINKSVPPYWKTTSVQQNRKTQLWPDLLLNYDPSAGILPILGNLTYLQNF
jgi:hypothetical protein